MAPLGIDRMRGRADAERPPVGEIHKPGCLRREQQINLLPVLRGPQFLQQSPKFLERRRIHALGGIAGGPLDQRLALQQFEPQVQPGIVLLHEFKSIDGERVLPGFDEKLVAAIPVERETGAPAVVVD